MIRDRTFARFHHPPCVIAVLALVLSVTLPPSAAAYLKIGFTNSSGQLVQLKWPQNPTYFVTNAPGNGVSVAETSAAVQNGFTTWSTVATQTLRPVFGGLTSRQPDVVDRQNTIGFVDLSRFPGFERVLGFTDFLLITIGTPPGLAESDIVINSAFAWSVDPAGVPGRFDLQSIVTHEEGHFEGLSHSAIGISKLNADGTVDVTAAECIMFPIAFKSGSIAARTLKADDVAGISDIYPTGDFRSATGSISGRILKGGQGVFGAHVVAFNTRNGKLVSNFSLDTSGRYDIAGLEPGPYVVRVEPIDDLNVDSFFDAGVDPVDINFRVAFFQGQVVVSAGGGVGGIDITVVPK